MNILSKNGNSNLGCKWKAVFCSCSSFSITILTWFSPCHIKMIICSWGLYRSMQHFWLKFEVEVDSTSSAAFICPEIFSGFMISRQNRHFPHLCLESLIRTGLPFANYWMWQKIEIIILYCLESLTSVLATAELEERILHHHCDAYWKYSFSQRFSNRDTQEIYRSDLRKTSVIKAGNLYYF